MQDDEDTPEETTVSPKLAYNQYKGKRIKFTRAGQTLTGTIAGYHQTAPFWFVNLQTYTAPENTSSEPMGPVLVHKADVVGIEDNEPSLPIEEGPETYRPQSLGQRRRSKKKSKKSKRRKKTTRRRKRIRKSRH